MCAPSSKLPSDISTYATFTVVVSLIDSCWDTFILFYFTTRKCVRVNVHVEPRDT